MNAVGELMPARFATPTRGGSAASNVSNAACTEASSATSAPTPTPCASWAAAISAAVAAAASPSRSSTATDQPSRASRSAVARPIPRGEAAPVTTTDRSAGNATGVAISLVSFDCDSADCGPRVVLAVPDPLSEPQRPDTSTATTVLRRAAAADPGRGPRTGRRRSSR